MKRPSIEVEYGNLDKPGTIIWSYTGIAYMLTLGWRKRNYGKRSYIAVIHYNNKLQWLPRDIIKKQRWFKRSNSVNRKEGSWHDVWQITPKM